MRAEFLVENFGVEIVHRDLKPENIFITADAEAPGGERVKILDFGIAKITTGALARTRRDAFLGTPLYSSPEQCGGAANVEPRSDVYSLGIILYEMLCGQPPFVSEMTMKLMAKHMFEEPAPLHKTLPAINRRVEQLVLSLLRKNFDERPTMSEVAKTMLQLSKTIGESGPVAVEPGRAAVSAAAASPLTRDVDVNAKTLAAGTSAFAGDAPQPRAVRAEPATIVSARALDQTKRPGPSDSPALHSAPTRPRTVSAFERAMILASKHRALTLVLLGLLALLSFGLLSLVV